MRTEPASAIVKTHVVVSNEVTAWSPFPCDPDADSQFGPCRAYPEQTTQNPSGWAEEAARFR